MTKADKLMAGNYAAHYKLAADEDAIDKASLFKQHQRATTRRDANEGLGQFEKLSQAQGRAIQTLLNLASQSGKVGDSFNALTASSKATADALKKSQSKSGGGLGTTESETSALTRAAKIDAIGTLISRMPALGRPVAEGLGGGMQVSHAFRALGMGGPVGAIIGATAGLGIAAKSLAETAVKLGASSLAGGSEAIDSSQSILMMTIGKHFAFLVPTVAATLLTAADAFDSLGLNSESFGQLANDVVIPAISATSMALGAISHVFADLYAKASKFAGKLASIAEYLGGKDSTLAKQYRASEEMLGTMAKGGEKVGNKLGEFSVKAPQSYAKNYSDVVKTLMSDLAKAGGMQAGIGSVADMWKQIQMATMKDPLEQRKLDIQHQSLQALLKIDANTSRQFPASQQTVVK